MSLIKTLDRRLKNLDISQKELNELKLQLLDNAEEIKNDFLNEGFSEEEAEKKAIDSMELDELVKSIKEGSIKKSLLPNRIISSVLIILYTLFVIKCVKNISVISSPLLHGSFIPFKFTFNFLSSIFTGNFSFIDDVYFLDQLLILLLFIPFGIFIPIIINKYNNLKPNLIIFIVFNIVFSLLFYFPYFNFDITVLRILSCMLGFYIIKLMLNCKMKLN